MRKILTLTAAVLASFSLWAADPAISFEIESTTNEADVIKDYTEATENVPVLISTDSWNSSHYINLGNSPTSCATIYLGVKVLTDAYRIDSIAILAAGSGNSKSIEAAFIGWTDSLKEDNKADYAAKLAYTSASSSGSSKSSAVWYTVNTSSWEAKEVRIYRQVKGIVVGGAEAADYYSKNGTCRIFGLKVWLKVIPPYLKAIEIAGVDATVDQDNSKIIAELPYGTVINDALDAIVAADLTYGGSANSFEIASDHSKITVSDGVNSKDYAFELTVNTSVSTDATLKSLSLNDVAITLEDGVYSYNVELPYAADVNVVAEANDAAAKGVNIDKSVAGKVTITVTAQNDGTQDYVVNYSFFPAKKDLLSVKFENEIKGFITNGKIKVPYLAGSTQPAFVSATFNGADGEPTAVVDGDNLKVTGIDGIDSLYAIEYVEVSPATLTYNTEITFDSTETYFFTVYGWDKDKGWKFAKKVEEATNKRVSEGKIFLYIALPAAKSVKLTSGTAAERDVNIYVNGVKSSVTKTAKKNETITLTLNESNPNFIFIEDNQTAGDGGFVKMYVESDATAIDNTDAAVKATKVLRDGQVLILRDGKFFNALGVEVK